MTKRDRFSDWIFNSFRVTEEGLGLYRIFAVLFILLFLLPPAEAYDFLGSLPSDFYSPPPGPMWLFDGFPPEVILNLFHSVLILALCCLLLGFKTTAASFATGLSLLVLKGFFYSVGKINHDLLIAVLPMVMAYSNWGSAYSIDSLLAKQKGSQDKVQSWPLVLLALILGFMMFTAGFSKILGGWLYLDTQASFGHLFKQYFINQRQDLLSGYALQLDHWFLWELIDYLTILFEVGFLFAVARPKTTRLFISFAVLFHFSIMLLLNISFLPNFVAYTAFLNWPQINSFFKHQLKISYAAPVMLILLFLGIKLMILIAAAFEVPSLSSDLEISDFYILVIALPVALGYIILQLYRAASAGFGLQKRRSPEKAQG